MRNRPWVIGLIGGIGSGKSTVAKMLEKEGAEVLEADRVAHAVLDLPAVRRRLVSRWGKGIVLDGRVSRGALAKAAFRSPASIRQLNTIVHPEVRKAILRAIARCRRAVFVVDAPLLLEAGAGGLCDRIVFVHAPAAVRWARVARRGWTRGELRKRERFQWGMSRKRKNADVIVDNSGSRAAAARQVRALLRELRDPSHH
jgi:dephospho-CoA kinase